MAKKKGNTTIVLSPDGRYTVVVGETRILGVSRVAIEMSHNQAKLTLEIPSEFFQVMDTLVVGSACEPATPEG